jgi:hypothetical protein
VAGRRDDHAQHAEASLDDDLVRRGVVRVVVVRLRLNLIARAKHEARVLRHERDGNVEQKVALAQVVVGSWLPVEAVVFVLGHAKDSLRRESFKARQEAGRRGYSA